MTASADPSAAWRRVAVIGCPGAGKSRLSRALGERLALPVIHLDAHFHLPGWVEPPRDAWEARHAELIARDAWVIDGHFLRTLAARAARADAIVHLDLPRLACLRGAIGRVLREYGRVRADMAPGCREGFDAAFLVWIWRFRRDVRPATLALLREFASGGGQVVTLRSRREADTWLRSVPARPAG